MLIAGLDLAWGERNPDGVALIEATPRRAWLRDCRLVTGDAELLSWFDARIPPATAALVMVDAPIVCPNPTGSRPVDREIHRHFGRFHAGCHPANLTRCPRPARIAGRLVERGFALGWNPAAARRLVAEVYPHPAMVRWFGLSRIIKYKRGPVAEQRLEFRRLQQLVGKCLAERFPDFTPDDAVKALLSAPRNKAAEDRLDAFFCALIGLHHWRHRGRQSQVLGEAATGFIVVPV